MTTAAAASTVRVVRAIDWEAPPLKAIEEWEPVGGRVGDVMRRNLDFHQRMPLWLGMTTVEAEKLRVTRVALALSDFEAIVATEASSTKTLSPLTTSTYVRVRGDGATGATGATASTETTVATETEATAKSTKSGAPVWMIAMAIIGLAMATGCQHIEPPPGPGDEPGVGDLLDETSPAWASPEVKPRTSSQ